MNTNIDTRSGAPQTTSPPPVTQQKGTTGVELAIQVGARLADLASGKGLLPTIEANGTEDADAVAKNEAIQKAETVGLQSQMEELQSEIKQAFVVIASPQLHTADDVLAAQGLITAVSNLTNVNGGLDTSGVAKLDGTTPASQANNVAKVDGTAPASPPAHEYNAFLSGIVSVALLEAMMEFMKSQEVGEKVASQMYLQTKAVTEDCTDAMVKNIKEKAQAEALEDIIKAACSAGSIAVSLGGGYKSMKAESTTEAQTISTVTRGLEQVFTGFLQNAALAPLAIVKGDLDAQKAVLDMMKQFLDTLMQKENEMGNDYQKNFDSFNDALKQWIDALSRIGNKLSAHG